MFRRFLIGSTAAVALAAQAAAQVPATWTYSFDGSGNSQATYNGNVIIKGSCKFNLTTLCGTDVSTAVTSFNSRVGAVVLLSSDVTGVSGSLISGTPSNGHCAQFTSSTTIHDSGASCGTVAGVLSFNARAGTVTLLGSDVTGVGGSLISGTPVIGDCVAFASATSIIDFGTTCAATGTLTAGAGIALTGVVPNRTIANTGSITAGAGVALTGVAPFQTLANSGSITAGSGIASTGVAPFQTLANSGSITAGAGISLTGVAPFQTVTNTGTVAAGTGLVVSAGTISLVTPVAIANGGNGSASPGVVAGAGIGLTGSWPTQTVANSGSITAGNGIATTGVAPNQTVSNSGSLTAGVGIALTGSAPSQTVTSTGTITAGSGVSVSGTWPAITVAATGSGGTVTSIVAGTGLSGGTITTTGTIGLTSPVAVANGGSGTTTATGSAGNIVLSVAPTITGVLSETGSVDVSGTTVGSGTIGHVLISGTTPAPSGFSTGGGGGMGVITLSVTNGFQFQGYGNTNDFEWYNRGGTGICAVATNTANLSCSVVTVTNNLISTNAFSTTNIKNQTNSNDAWAYAAQITLGGTGLGTTPTKVNQNGTFSGFIVVGSSPANATFTIASPTGFNHGFGCFVNDITSNSSTVIGQTTPVNTGTATFQAYSRTTGLAQALTAADELYYQCGGG